MIKKHLWLILGIGLFTAWVSTGTVSAQSDTINFALHFGNPPPPPPPVRVEVQAPPPSPHHIWIAGHWGFDKRDGQWVWHPGYYLLPPVPWAKYRPAAGVVWHGEYYWVKGHWDY